MMSEEEQTTKEESEEEPTPTESTGDQPTPHSIVERAELAGKRLEELSETEKRIDEKIATIQGLVALQQLGGKASAGSKPVSEEDKAQAMANEVIAQFGIE